MFRATNSQPVDRLIARFEQQADLAPDACAASYQRAQLSYRELDRRANQLARHLRALGVKPDDIVALAIPRSLQMVVGVLAVLKVGAAYAPLDPAYPASRLAFMLADTRAAVLLTTSALLPQLPSASQVVLIDAHASEIARQPETRLPDASQPDQLAYVIYTSGSTGSPKGVAMPRGSLENLLAWQLQSSVVGPGEKTLQFAPLSFDVHFQELFGTWAAGGELVLVDEELRLDTRRLLELLEEQQVARLFLPFIALQSMCDVAVVQGLYPSGLREVITAGEQLVVTKSVTQFFTHLPACTLHNHYGPSETHVVTSYTLRGAPTSWPRIPPIGRPIPGVTMHLLDEARCPVPQGAEGELFFGGSCLARGYLHRPDLTELKFLPDPFSDRPGARLYRTGDVARIGADGECEFLGRLDSQVKVRGYRVELGEIEVALDTHPAVQQAVVIAREDEPGDKRLVAYVVLLRPLDSLAGELRRHLASLVPEYMMPSAFVALTDFPRTPSGKVDRRGLPPPEAQRPELTTPYVAPEGPLEQLLSKLWARLIKLDRVGVLDNFFELGGNSLLALKTIAQLRHEARLDLPVAQIFAQPTVRQLVAYLEGGREVTSFARAQRGSRGSQPVGPIAIVGMSGRFPGAATLDELWEVLSTGRDTTTQFSRETLDESVGPALRDSAQYVRRRGVLEHADKFDSAFFLVNPREADVIDPQQRVLLEVAWATLEDAGYVPETVHGAVGVFAGTHNNSYFGAQLLTRPDVIEGVGSFVSMIGNEKDYVATRIAHRLNLTGPAISVHTACSTSLVAVAMAVQSLRSGECDLALAGGAAITVPQNTGHLYQEGGMLSSDGHTRSFDARAQGTTFGDGVAMVALKRLSDALADGDHVRAVILGAAINNDGANKASFTAPSVDGQAAVVAAAQASAGVDARSISYVEAHGTATPLGDPIEVEALTRAFGEQTSDRGYCALSSVKSNLGHLTAAAGVTGLIKTVLALEHELLPATVHYQSPNPNIDFASTPFFVVDQQRPWPRTGVPRRAGVSSFGVGGTNAHVVVEEAPPRSAPSDARPEQLLLLSARTPAALELASERLASHLGAHPEGELADLAYTLHIGRRTFEHRRFVVARNVTEALAQLDQPSPLRAGARATKLDGAPLVFMFPGQGAQYVDMGHNLYRDEPLFRVVVDQCADILLPRLGLDLRQLLYPAADAREAAAAQLMRTEYTQPALFTIEYALATLWMSWGIKPTLMIGHSVGEFVCAVLASVMTLEDALALVAARGKLIQSLPSGSMLSVRLPATTLEPRLAAHWPQLSIASSNGPSLCVVAGPDEAVLALSAELATEGVLVKPLHTSHAFHSSMMDAAVEPFAALVRKTPLAPPSLPFISTVTGVLATAEQVTDPMYWARHMRATVRFAAAVAEAWREPGRVLLEVGPRSTLATLARQQITDRTRQAAISSLSDAAEDDAEWTAMLRAVGQLWLAGVPVDPARFYQTTTRVRVPLPTYAFDRRTHWVRSPSPPLSQATHQGAGAPKHALPPSSEEVTPMPTRDESHAHRTAVTQQLLKLLDDASGIDLADADPRLTFLELGFDSLLLTQVSMALKKTFGVDVGFRALLEDLSSLELLAAHVAQRVAPPPAVQSASPQPVAVAPAVLHAAAPTSEASPGRSLPAALRPGLEAVVEAQIALMREQLAALSQGQPATVELGASPALQPPSAEPRQQREPDRLPAPQGGVDRPSQFLEGEEPAKAIKYDVKTAFGAIARIHVSSEVSLSPLQRAKLEALTAAYTGRTSGSKQWAQEHRGVLADPRVVTGFRPPIKELVYPIVAVRSKGARLWDVDGNEYIDALNGFGSNFLGHAAPVVQAALKAQIDLGYEIGPMQPSVGAASQLVCELTGLDRAAFCNTGSEAVMGALRIARTVTGRSQVVVFGGSYHGIFDEVIVRGTKRLRSLPAAPGIMPESLSNVLVLDYGTPESMAIIKERAHELAAVMVEPVQSRRPDFQPVEFLRELRGVTEQAGCAYIWDEVITGFRAHPGGAQALFGVKADLATYGKVAGGGLPLGVIAGASRWMDALDGGAWSFGDDSAPTVGVTYFAGTFVRHPLTMAATEATLRYLKAEGPKLQQDINAKTERLATTLNAYFDSKHVPVRIKHFSSLWKAFFTEDHPMQDLLFCYLRLKGIHIWDGFPCFLTAAHTDADVDLIVDAFKQSADEMAEASFFPARAVTPLKLASFEVGKPPAPGARLGRDPQGNPAWFVPNPAQLGKFMKYESQ